MHQLSGGPGLNSSPAQRAGELWCCKTLQKMCGCGTSRVHPNQNVWLHHCSKAFCKEHLKSLPQVALFILLRLNQLGQRKLPIVISLSRMLCFGRVCASCALNVSAALKGAYTLTSTSNCIHEEEGKYIIICINWYQMFATNISNSSQSTTRFFSWLQASEVTSKVFASLDGRNIDSDARPTDTAELKEVLSFLYCVRNNIIVLLLYW